jgi:mitogen-activated protein kinase kinase kinase
VMSSRRVWPLSYVDVDILLDGVGNIKFSDFGAAKVFARQGKTKAGVTMARTNLNSMTGTPMYMSPEGISPLPALT